MTEQAKTIVADCPYCEAAVAAEVLKTLNTVDPEEGLPYLYAFLKCPKCGFPLVTVQEDYGGGWETATRVFPPQTKGLGYAVPNPISRAFDEARTCFGAKAYTATAIMCRKTAEGLCEEQRAKGRTFAAKLQNLKDEEIIEKRLFEWADELRLSGNEAAHKVEVTITKEDATDLLEFTRALMEYVYTFGKKFDAFKDRRAASKDGD